MKSFRHIILILLLVPLFGYGLAGQGIQITEHGSIRSVMNQYISQNQNNANVEGWRIQIISTDDRRKMESYRDKFESMYPGMYINWEHRNPWYLVKIGAFRTKLELQGFIQELKDEFPQAIPIQDQVRKTELLR